MSFLEEGVSKKRKVFQFNENIKNKIPNVLGMKNMIFQ